MSIVHQGSGIEVSIVQVVTHGSDLTGSDLTDSDNSINCVVL